MRRELKSYNLPEPEFKSKGGMFIVTFRNNMNQVSEVKIEDDLIKKILEYCSIPRSRDELTAFTGLFKAYLRRSVLAPLLEQGLPAMTLPDKPKSTYQKYYSTKIKN